MIFGGLIAVMHTDAFQGLIMLVGMTILLVQLTSTSAASLPQTPRSTRWRHSCRRTSRRRGYQGWTSMPVFGSPIWFTLITTLVLGVGIGVLAQPQLVVRFMTRKGRTNH